MRKTLLRSAFIGFIVILLVLIISCQKWVRNSSRSAETNIHLVSDSAANAIAINFNPSVLLDEANAGNHSPFRYLLHGQNKVKNKIIINDTYGVPALYVFNFENNAGFIFVSADYQMKPLMAYIERGEFKNNMKMPEGLQMWLNKTIENFELVRRSLYDNQKVAAAAWKNYFKSNGSSTNVSAAGLRVITAGAPPPPPPNPCDPPADPTYYTTGPLLPVTWGQLCTYNESCDLTHTYSCGNSCSNTRPATGCVATSMAQIIRYYQFPTSAYGYSTMPTTSGDSAVERLMSNVGVSVSMAYGCSSSAYGTSVEPSFKTTFGYSSANRSAYTRSDYDSYSEIEDNLFNYSWPVIFQGYDDSYGGHQWVCDGCNLATYYICSGGVVSETALLFHINWGWHEVIIDNVDFNGWFNFDDWTVYGAGSGSSNINFQYYNYAVTEIHP
jgi:hypothetical protein